MQNSRILKSILLIVGTSIGTGILALPLATAEGGVLHTCIALCVCFLFMTVGAFYVTEVTLCSKKNASFLSLAQGTLGRPGQLVTSFSYLLLLYALTAMYILVGSGWFLQLLKENRDVALHPNIGILVFAACLMPFVQQGMRSVGRINQIITIALLFAFFGMLSGSLFEITPRHLGGGNPLATLPALPLILTSFGFSIVMPVLCSYLKQDVRALKISLGTGSLIALIAYILWEIVIYGTLGVEGEQGLKALAARDDNGTAIILALEHASRHPWVGMCGRFFVIFAVISSVLGVTLSLYHFIKDAFSLKDNWAGQLIGILATFAPPVLLLLIYPMGLQHILSLAGLFVAVLLGILPALMARRARRDNIRAYKVPGGTPLIILSILFFSYVIIQALLNWTGVR